MILTNDPQLISIAVLSSRRQGEIAVIQLQKFDDAAVRVAFTALTIAFVNTAKGRKRLAEAIALLETHAASGKVVPLVPARGRLCEDTMTEAVQFLRIVEKMVE